MISWRSADYSAAASYGASCLFHAAALAVAWMICINPDGDQVPSGAILVSTVDGSLAAPEFEVLATELDVARESAGGSAPQTVQVELSSPSLDPPNLDLPNSELMPSDYANWDEIGWSDQVSELDGLRFGAGTGLTSGNGEGDGKFFGLEGGGDSFVFVVDASGSMGRPYPAPARNRFNRVKLELIQTIGAMSPEQKFCIIFFNGGTLPMPVNHLIPAEPIYQEQFLRWMVDVPCGGDTEPEDALLLSLQLDPDVIYFLTDGAFAYRVTETVRRANTREIPIHTIGFGDNEGERWLLKIAEQSGGEYQFITEENDAMLQAAE